MTTRAEGMWTEKYRPERVGEVVGNEESKKQLLDWLKRWEGGDVGELGVFLVGPQGVGKTSLVAAAADQLGYNLVELNASDTRTKSMLEENLGSLPNQKTIDSYHYEGNKGNLVFLDEVGGIHGRKDRGGLKKLLDIAEEEGFPLVLSANYPDPQKHRRLLKDFKVIKFSYVNLRLVHLLLRHIARNEGLELDEEDMRKIVSRTAGDVRAAVNNLQEVAQGHEIESQESLTETLPLEQAVRSVLDASDTDEARDLVSSSLASPPDIYKSLAESVAQSNLPSDVMSEALDVLSRLDVLMGRIRKEQHWKLYRELIDMVPQVLETLEKGSVSYYDGIPEYVFAIYRNRGKQSRFDEVAGEVAESLRMSSRKAKLEVFPSVYRDMSRAGNGLPRALQLDEEEREAVREAYG